MQRYVSMLVIAAVTALTATVASSFEPGQWYASLAKPDWTPPNWLFGPVWSVLYVMIAIAGWLVWRAQGLGLALFVWLAGLCLNAAWSYLMFGQNNIEAAMIDLGLLWVAIVVFILAARRVSGGAALLFVPYLAWVSFAGALNFAILQLN
ncbi:MAG: TspO/MBR family protein [Hyphomicrobiaceae bacterium]|nr:TspO/MBR family protein [Hyphomicrobiaceae bacterium]